MKVGVIGLGSIGLRRARIASDLGHEIIGYDLFVRTEKWRPRLILSMDEFWSEKPDAVLICTPPDSHMELIIEAKKHGVHCFCEKPLSDKRQYLVPKADGWTTMVACNWRFHVGPAKIKYWLQGRTIGKVISALLFHYSNLPEWGSGRDYKTRYTAKTGVILDVGSHWIDLASMFFGPPVLRGAASVAAESIGLECDGNAEIILQHPESVLSSVSLSMVTPRPSLGVHIEGMLGSIDWWDDGDTGGVQVTDLRGMMLNRHTYVTTDEVELMYVKEMESFFKSCEKGEVSVNPLRSALVTFNILMEAKDV